MRTVVIDSIACEELAPYARLTEAQLRQAGSGEGLFVAESIKVILSAMQAGCRPLSFLSVSGRIGEIVKNCGAALPDDVPIYTAELAVIEKLTGYRLHRGELAVMERPAISPPEMICEGKKRIAVLEGVIDSTNIGAIFRSAAALGVEAVLVGSSCCDPLNRRAVRVSMGTVFLVPWTVLPCLEDERKCTDTARLRRMGFTLAALALDKNAVAVTDPRLKRIERLALLLGSEGDGLEARTVQSCDYTAIIPMHNGVDSLNVAAASAVAFWELAGGRRSAPELPEDA